MLTIDMVSLTLGLFIGICIGTIFGPEISLIIKTVKGVITSYVHNYKKSIQDK